MDLQFICFFNNFVAILGSSLGSEFAQKGDQKWDQFWNPLPLANGCPDLGPGAGTPMGEDGGLPEPPKLPACIYDQGLQG